MLITCPNCQSVFKLPDTENMNLKMRCTICSQVFALSDAIVLPEEAPVKKNSDFQLNTSFGNDGVKKKKEKQSKGKRTFLRLFLILLFSLIAAGGALWNFTNYLDPLKEMFSEEKATVVSKQNAAITQILDRVQLLELADVRQFVVPNSENDNFEKLTVIEGKVVNGFDTARSFVELEATLYDEAGNPLLSKTQMGGPSVSLFQLQVLGKAELEEALRDQISILNYNVDVPPKGSIPFMFIFYDPPETAVNLNVKIVDAQPSTAETASE